MRGVYEFTVEDETMGFRFDMVSASILEELEGKNLSLILYEFSEASGGIEKIRIGLLLNVLVAAAQSYAEFKETDQPGRSIVSSWIQKLDATELYKMIGEGFTMYTPKNLKAPKKGAGKEGNSVSMSGAE